MDGASIVIMDGRTDRRLEEKDRWPQRSTEKDGDRERHK